MPMGGRLTQGRENRAISTSPQNGAQEISPEARHGEQSGLSPEASSEIRSGVQEGAAQDMSREAYRAAQGGTAQGALFEASQRMTEGPSQDAAVTEEELEMLLKEFLTG